jgi:hypothetical protein
MDEAGRVVRLSESDPNSFELITIASTPGLRDAISKEKAVPGFFRAHSEWPETRRRIRELEGLVPMDAPRELWDKYIIGVKAVLETLKIDPCEDCHQYVSRIVSEERFARGPGHSGPAPCAPYSVSFAPRRSDDEMEVTPTPRSTASEVLGYFVKSKSTSEKGCVTGVRRLPDGAFQLEIEWGSNQQKSNHTWDTVCKEMHLQNQDNVDVHPIDDDPTPNPRGRKAARIGDVDSALSQWKNICSEMGGSSGSGQST